MKLKLPFVFILLTYCLITNGQKTNKRFDYLNLKGGYNYGKSQNVYTGISLTNNHNASIFEDLFYNGPYLTLGYNWGSKNLITSKLGYEYNGFLMLFIGRISIIDYTDFKENQINLMPEIGLTLMGFLNFTYGYNFNLTDKDKFDLTGHYFGLDVHIKIKKLE